MTNTKKITLEEVKELIKIIKPLDKKYEKKLVGCTFGCCPRVHLFPEDFLSLFKNKKFEDDEGHLTIVINKIAVVAVRRKS